MELIQPTNCLACPIDKLLLERAGNTYTCPSGHSFDIARQKYINLLPVQDKRSKAPGDTKEMVLARTNFLDSGIYAPISRQVNTIIHAYIEAQPKDKNITILDAGCGEGYYLNEVRSTLESTTELDAYTASLIGLDISKPAIIEATKRNREKITWLVGTNRNLPIQDKSLDIIICMFGYPVFDEFHRCLKKDGIVILVEAGNKHLIEIKQHLYSNIKTKNIEAQVTKQSADLFEVSDSSDNTSFKTPPLDKNIFSDLLAMTPYQYRFKAEDQDVFLCKLNKLTVEPKYFVLKSML